MSGTVIINSYGKWYSLNIHFKAEPSYVEPLLTNYYPTQKTVEHILDTCGLGIKTFFVDSRIYDNVIHHGMHDHSPDWCCSPINHLVRAVAMDYNTGPHPRPDKYYNTMDDAVDTTTQPHLYIWCGQKWEYRKIKYKRFKGLPWSRNRINV